MQNKWKITFKRSFNITCLLCLFAFIALDRFDEVIEVQSNETVKNKLRLYKEGGIEKELEIEVLDVDSLLAYAMTFRGVRHQMGGTTSEGIDCSGLVMVVFLRLGIELPHSAHEQGRYGKIVSKQEDLKKGDLVFFYDSYTTTNFITHSGIYLGNSEFIHASNKYGVMISKVNDPGYWGTHYLFGTRLK